MPARFWFAVHLPRASSSILSIYSFSIIQHNLDKSGFAKAALGANGNRATGAGPKLFPQRWQEIRSWM
jgi:hypothetical protein